MDEKTFQLIDGLITPHRETALHVLDSGERGGDLEGAGEVVGHRFGIQPKAIQDWWQERKTRIL